MSSPPTLGLFGVFHMDRLGKVTAELDVFVGDAEAVFIEYPADPMDLREYVRLVARVPAYAVGALLFQLLLYAPLFACFNRDLYPTEMVAVRRVADGMPVHAVDEHPNEKLRRAGPAFAVANWLVVGLAGWLAPTASAVTAAVALAGGLLPQAIRRRGHRYPALGLALVGTAVGVGLAVGGLGSVPLFACGLVFFLVVVRTLDHRNEVMLDRIEAQAAAAGYDEVVLVTGKAHLGGLAALASERGFAVPRVHVSRWLRAGRTVTDFEPGDLPTLGRTTLAPTEGLTPETGVGSLARRAGAAVVDLLVVVIPAAVLWVVFSVVAVIVAADPTATLGALLVGLPVVGVVGYHGVLERLFGTTVGKRLFGLAVVGRGGGTPSTRSVLVRNLLRPASLLTGYLIGGLLVAATGRHQHLGDRLAGTVVVARDRVTDDPAGSAGDVGDESTADDSAAGDEPTDQEAAPGSNSTIQLPAGRE